MKGKAIFKKSIFAVFFLFVSLLIGMSQTIAHQESNPPALQMRALIADSNTNAASAPVVAEQQSDSSQLLPHGYCLLWDESLLLLHVISDSVIALSYF